MANNNQSGNVPIDYGGDILKIAVIALAYFLAHQIAFFFPDSQRVIMAVWPAGGIGLAAFLLMPYRLWPALVAVFYLSGVSADVFLANRPFLAAVGYMTGNMVESLGCAWLIIKWGGRNIRFDRVKEILALVTGAILVNAISSCIGAGTGVLAQGANFSKSWLSWYVSDGLGILLITPVIVCWTKIREFIPRSGKGWIFESGLFFAMWSVTAWQALQPGNFSRIVTFHPYMLLALLAWPALRLGQHIVSLSLIVLAAICIFPMAAHPELAPFGGNNPEERLLLVQVFLAFIGFAGYLLAAAIAESKSDKQLSLDEQARLKALADNLPNGMVHQFVRNHDGSKHFQYISAAVERLNGVSAAEVLRNPQVLYSQIMEEDRLMFDAAEEESAKNLSVFNVSFRGRRPDGQIRWVQISSTPRRLSDGRILWDGIQLDITDRMKADEALRKANQLFSLFMHYSPIYTYIKTVTPTESRVLQASDNFLEMIGIPGQEMIGKTMTELFPPEFAARIAADDWAVVVNGKVMKFDEELNGRSYTTIKFPIVLEDKTLLAGYTIDVTEHKQSEEALRRSEEAYRRIIETAQEGICILDPEGRIKFVNPFFAQMLGYAPEELIGRRGQEFIPEAEADNFRLELEASAKGNSSPHFEGRFFRKNGSELLVLGSGTPIFDSQGAPSGSFAMFVDITDRIKAERALQDQRNMLAKVFDSVPNILMLVDKDGHIVDINRVGVEFAGRKKERLINHLGGEVFGCLNALIEPGCGRNENCSECSVRSRVMRTFSTGQSIYNEQGQLSVRRGDKVKTLDLLISTAPINLQHTEQVLVSITDITPLKNSERERENLQTMLTQVQKMEVVGQLAGGVAHDFNNILGAMMMRLQILKDDISLPPEQIELVEDFETDIRRAADLTRQLLLFGRRQVMQVRTLDLNELVENLLKMVRRLIGEQIKLVFQVDAAQSSIEADPGMIEQVVLNLCVNARDAMPKGGNLSIRTQVLDIDEHRTQINPEAYSGRFACLMVSDQGCGIDANTLQHILEPFFTTKEVGKGTGLGLSTVHGIVKQHKGWVEVESVPGQGTVFRVYLPASTTAAESAAVKTREPLPLGKETILLVEDEANYRMMMAILMRRQGYTVIEAANGVEAMRQWESHQDKIDLLLTDMVMPEGMTGLELGEKIRSQKPDTPVVISSGYSIDLLERANSNLSGFIYLSKPCDAEKLIKTLRKALDQKA